MFLNIFKDFNKSTVIYLIYYLIFCLRRISISLTRTSCTLIHLLYSQRHVVQIVTIKQGNNL